MAYGAAGGMSAPPNPGPTPDTMTDGPMEETKPGKPEEEYEGETGILPKALMAGKDFKVGDEIVLQVTRVGENDFEVKYASEKGEGEHSEPHEEGAYGEETTPTSRGDRSTGMASMME